MKIKDLLDVQEVLEKRKTPCDMHNEELNQHFSRSKNEYMDILDCLLYTSDAADE